MNLYPDQQTLFQAVSDAFAAGHRKVMMQLATGGGKTVIFSHVASRAFDRGSKVLLITNRKELHKQGGHAFNRVGVIFSELTANTKYPPGAQVVVAMSETLKRRMKAKDYMDFISRFKLIIIDEAHLGTFDKLFEVIDENQYVLGASATPIRTGKQPALEKFYDVMVRGPEIHELIENDRLCPIVNFSTPVDLSSVKMRGGEYDQGDQARVYSDVKLFSRVLENWLEHAKGKKTIVFAAGVENSKKLCEMFRDAGYSSAHVDDSTPTRERDAIFSAFARGDIMVLCNVGIATMGYDCPSIECVVLYRATTSVALYLQMVGRGSRVLPGKSYFIMLDFGTNFHRLGSWDQPRIWSLEKPKRKSKKDGEIPTKMCPNCEALLAAHVRVCPACGYEWVRTAREEIAAKLVKMSPSDVQRLAKSATVEELEIIREERGYKAGWALHKLRSAEEFVDYERMKGYKKGWALNQIKRFLGLDMTWGEVYH
jgi:superfamily II DNA or RNA helicase